MTDEDAFALPSEAVLSIRVGGSSATCARYYLRSQEPVELLLTTLVELRAQRSSPRQ